MKKHTLTIIIACVMIMMASCEKQASISENNSSVSGRITNSTQYHRTSVLKDGELYLQQLSSTKNTGAGWFLDIGVLQENINASKKTKVSSLGNANLYCGGISSVDLLAGQNILMGTLTYANDATNLYVTYTTNSDWYMSEVHLFVGLLENVPKSGGGTPSPGRFPMKQTFSSSNLAQEINWTIPLSSITSGSNFVIAAHTSVLRVDIDGDVVAKETAWAAGTRFQSNKNWATYISASLKPCDSQGEADLTQTTKTNN